MNDNKLLYNFNNLIVINSSDVISRMSSNNSISYEIKNEIYYKIGIPNNKLSLSSLFSKQEKRVIIIINEFELFNKFDVELLIMDMASDAVENNTYNVLINCDNEEFARKICDFNGRQKVSPVGFKLK